MGHKNRELLYFSVIMLERIGTELSPQPCVARYSLSVQNFNILFATFSISFLEQKCILIKAIFSFRSYLTVSLSGIISASLAAVI